MKDFVTSEWFLLITGLASILGLALAVYSLRAEFRSRLLFRWRRWQILLLASLVILVAVGIGLYLVRPATNKPTTRNSNYRGKDRNYSIESVHCRNPPLSAILNYWPVTYSSPAEYCHDYQAVDARFTTDDGQYSQTQDEWEQGRTAHVGNELYILVWINNGASDNAEEINPGQGIARNVRLTTETETEPGTLHYIYVRFSGDNTNTIESRFKIITDEHEHLEVVPLSGQMRNFTASEILKDKFEMGNNTFSVGDIKPLFSDGRFIRFRVKVVG
jgi:hypothetical protein